MKFGKAMAEKSWLVVTGAASGIGLGTATALAQAGAKVAINHLPDDSRGPQAVQELKAKGLDVISAPGRVGVPPC